MLSNPFLTLRAALTVYHAPGLLVGLLVAVVGYLECLGSFVEGRPVPFIVEMATMWAVRQANQARFSHVDGARWYTAVT